MLAFACAAMLSVAALTAATCPFGCHGHGFCVGLNDELCQCWGPWEGTDALCAHRACPQGPAWQAFPDADGDVHGQMVECSNRGTCDTLTGECTCDYLFAGTACEILWCENQCSGHGECVSMREAAARRNDRFLFTEARYNDWDADRVFGCVCEPGWQGHDCSSRTCPLGDDPLTAGTYETQIIHTVGDHTDEIQLITISGGTDVDEIQVMQFRELTTGPDPFAGDFTLSFDSREVADFCNLCNVSTATTTAALAFDVSAGDLEFALESLENIDQVSVTRAAVPGFNGFIWSITFDGAIVGGNVPELILDSDRIGGDDLFVEFSTLQDGSEITGSLDLSYDDTDPEAHPGGTVGPDTVRLDITERGRLLEEAIATMDAVGTVSASTIVDGGPGLQWLLTFTEAVGNLSTLGCNPAGLSGDASISCTVDTLQQGNFLDGNFSVTLNGEPSEVISWNATAADVEDALQDLDDTVGHITVSRTRSFLTTELEWSGTYDWTVTFSSLPFDGAVTMTADNGTLTGAGGQEGAVIGTAEAPVVGTETNPLNAEVSEVQIIECSCPADCTGGVQLKLYDETTETINHDDSAATLVSKLVALTSVHGLVVNYYGSPGDTLCDVDGVSAAITFTHDGGNIPSLAVASTAARFTLDSVSAPAGVAFTIKAGDGVLGDSGGMTKEGSRVMTQCSNRGLCNTDGTCRCFFGFSRSNGAGIEVPAEQGEITNCGFQLRTVSDCPGSCSGRGTCSGAPDYVCSCDPPYEGAACEVVTCPSAASWFDEATADDTAHAIGACSNRGSCSQSADGASCTCTQPFTGVACQTMNCPGLGVSPGQSGGFATGCSGHGVCQTLQALGNFSVDSTGAALNGPTYEGWDAQKISGCVCDRHFYKGPFAQVFSDYTLHDCGGLTCPFGDDPKTYNQLPEVQSLSCTATGGSFTLSFRGNTTEAIATSYPAMAFENSVQAALEGIHAIRNVTVTFNEPFDSVCVAGETVETRITFVSEHGELPLLEVDDSQLTGSVVAGRVVTGTMESLECNRRGVCDRATGRCDCAPQFGSSNGLAENGTLGDCGFIHALWGYPFPLPLFPTDATTPYD